MNKEIFNKRTSQEDFCSIADKITEKQTEMLAYTGKNLTIKHFEHF